MGCDGTGMSCYEMGWDGTKKFVPRTSLPISTANLRNFSFGSLKLVADLNASFAFLIADKTIILISELISWLCRFFCFFVSTFCFSAWPVFSYGTRNSINGEKTFVFYSFRFLPAQLTRFGMDRNRAILIIAWRDILLSIFFLRQRISLFSPHDYFAW